MAGARGKRPTPAATVREFEEKYLELGVARAAAREVGIPETTGIDLARRLEKDSAFVQRRSELRARALPLAEAAILKGVEYALIGMQSPDRDGAAWYRSLVEAYKAIAQVRATLTDTGDVRPQEPTIIQYIRPDSVPDADDPVSS